MSRATRKKPYKTRRERLIRDIRNIKLILIFGGIALVCLILFRWQKIMDWFILTF
jgi:hypothetical protein